MKKRPKAPVLVVERDTAIRDAITALVETMGFRVVGVGDGRAARTMLVEQVPCMIVVNVDANGWDLEAERRRDARLAHVPVIGLLPEGNGVEPPPLGMVCTVHNPIDFDELERLLDHHCPPA